MIIIDFSSESEADIAESLKEKWLKNHPGQLVDIIQGAMLLNQTSITPLNLHQDSYKVYVICHCSPGSDSLSDPRKLTDDVHYTTVAHILTQLLATKENVVINLVSCASGRGDNDSPHTHPEKSFASKLQLALYNIIKINIPVVARLQFTEIAIHDGSKGTYPIDISFKEAYYSSRSTIKLHRTLSKQCGSKAIFTLNHHGEQLKLDADYYLWKRDVIIALKEVSQKSTNEKQKTFLVAWHETLLLMSHKQIAAALHCELDNQKSPLHIDDRSFIITFFVGISEAATIVNQLLARWNKIILSNNTFTHPIKVQTLS